MAAVRAAFKPEFLNRLDDVVVFDALGIDELARIVELQVGAPGRAAGRPAARRSRSRPAAREWLALTRATTRRTAPGRCAGWCSARSATGWPGRCWPARSATATRCGWTWKRGRNNVAGLTVERVSHTNLTRLAARRTAAASDGDVPTVAPERCRRGPVGAPPRRGWSARPRGCDAGCEAGSVPAGHSRGALRRFTPRCTPRCTAAVHCRGALPGALPPGTAAVHRTWPYTSRRRRSRLAVPPGGHAFASQVATATAVPGVPPSRTSAVHRAGGAAWCVPRRRWIALLSRRPGGTR